MEIQKTIEQEHCRSYCGLLPENQKDYEECRAHREQLYLQYLDELNLMDKVEVIRREFRWKGHKL